MDNVVFYGLERILYPSTNFFNSYNITNVSIYNSKTGFMFEKGLSNSRIENIYMENMTGGYLSLKNSTNVIVNNFTVERIQPVSDTDTGFYFAGAGSPNQYDIWEGGHDNHAYNIYMNGTCRSGFDMSQYEYNSTGTNITVIHSGHNGIDLHGQWNVTLRNVTSISSDYENFLLTSPNGNAGDHLIHNETGAVNVRDVTTLSHDIYVYDYHSINATGSALSSNRVVNFLVINLTSNNDGKVINHNFAKNSTFINVTGTNIRGTSAVSFGASGTYGYAEDVYLIDSSFYTSGAPITMYATKNARLLNVYSGSGCVFGGRNAEYSNNHYLDILVTDSNGIPINNGTILIESDVSNLSSMNGWAIDKNRFLIGSNGHTLSPVKDRENSPAITEYYKNYPQKENTSPNYTCNVVLSDNHAVSLSGITPDSSWYRPDPNIPTYTITAIIPDNSAGPHLIGFAPAEDNPFNPGEKKNFRVWTDEHLSTMEWYVDGSESPVHKGSLNYTWPVTEGNHIIKFVGSNANGTVNKTWQLGESSGDASVIAIAPEYQVVTPKQSFNLDITVDPSIPIAGTQLDFKFNSSRASANSVTEGNLFKQNGAKTHFGSGTIDNNAGKIKNIYSSIIGTSDISTPGTMATVNLTAGNRTGMAEFNILNVLISDINSKSVSGTVKNATVLIDTAPVIDPIYYPESVSEKTPVTFKVSAKDADGDRLTFSASGLPEGASFNKTSGDFAWTPAEGQAGVYTMTFEVSDGYLTDSKDVTITVNTNKPPVINYFEPLNGSSFSEGERINILVNASDEDGQVLNYIIKIDGVTHSTDPEYVWETDYSSSGNHAIEASVSDGIDEVKRQHTIYISECHPRWDVNEDGIVNILDIITVSQKYGTTVSKPYPRYDVNQDGLVNDQDLNLVRNHFGEIVN
ncbi:putative Ig domain-containing protein [Methanosarcina mazei]|nr:putative Ig domain-containing protein [Methanosarcina mazei]